MNWNSKNEADSAFNDTVDPTVNIPVADDRVEMSISDKPRGDWFCFG
jgi:hypothetical protein